MGFDAYIVCAVAATLAALAFECLAISIRGRDAARRLNADLAREGR